MIEITNSKVAGFLPRWAAFRGFTLLFDNPGESFAVKDGLQFVDCDKTSPFYGGLATGLQEIEPDTLVKRYLFCPLPYASYHVTAFDGINESNITAVSQNHRSDWENFLHDLPLSIQEQPLLDAIKASDLITASWPIPFQFAQLELWGASSLVATLKPQDHHANSLLQRLTLARERFAQQFETEFHVRPGEHFAPHVTLGYFANRTLAQQAEAEVDDWNGRFAPFMQDLSIEFQTISLYGFLDMATFFREAND